MTKISFKGVFTTDKGKYASGTTYATGDIVHTEKEIGRASCRERV